MFEMVREFRDALGIESTWAFMLVMFLLFGGIGAGVAWLVDRADKNARSQHVADVRGTQSVRVKFSSTQSIEVSNEPGHNDTIRLDAVGMLVQRGEADLELIRMVLAESVPLTVQTPDGRTRYATAPDRFTELPGAGSPNIDIAGWSSVAGPSFLFHRWKAPAHTVSIGQRAFAVKLLDVTDRSDSTRQLIAYTFGISEE